jgi:hypothetical protein
VRDEQKWLDCCRIHTVVTARLHTFNNVKDVSFDICSMEPKEIADRVAGNNDMADME